MYNSTSDRESTTVHQIGSVQQTCGIHENLRPRPKENVAKYDFEQINVGRKKNKMVIVLAIIHWIVSNERSHV